MILLDLFAGIGGFAKGFLEAGLPITRHYFSEIDKQCISVYQKHFTGAELLGDVRTITAIPERPNIVTFGFPCQDLSIAGKGTGLDGDRSGLFFEAIRIIRETQPDVFIFENVRGLLSNNGGRDFTRCLKEISNIGLYDCEWQLLNTRWLLPQNRERVYFVGHLGNGSTRKVFPVTESDFVRTERNTSEKGLHKPASTLMARAYASWNGNFIVENTKRNAQAQRVNSIYKHSVTLSAQGGGQGARTGLYAVPVITPQRLNKRQKGRRFKEDGEPMFTLTSQDTHGVFDGIRIRRLTPVECERLQGFPDDWTRYGTGGKELSDNARYRMLGNAVSVPVVKLIAERMFS